MERQELAKKISQIALLHGQFKLRSGKTSQEYFDKYRFESQPNLLHEIAEKMAPMIPKNTEILAGLELGGVPIATALSLKTGIPVSFVRKKAKDYGTCRLAEGIDITNRQVCIIEDVITTGGQVFESALELKKLGAKLQSVLCVIKRGEGVEALFAAEGLPLQWLFSAEDLR